MGSTSRLLWNLFRLVLAVGFFGLLVVAVVFLFQGRYQAMAAIAAVMSALFFSINVSNFWEYRWEEADTGAKAVVVAPVVLSLGAVGVASFGAVWAFASLGVIIVFWFMVTRRRPDLRFSRVPVRLELGDEKVELKYAHVTIDSIRWEEIVRVAAAPEAGGPIDDELFFFLENEEGDGCVIPNKYARELLDRLQRLEEFDNAGLVEAATAGVDSPRVLWEGRPGGARACGRDASAQLEE